MLYGENHNQPYGGSCKALKFMNTQKLSVISYNMGTDIRDFGYQCKYLGKDLSEEKNAEEMYIKAQESTTKNLMEVASVYLLQEVQNEERSLITGLKKAGYVVCHILNNSTAETKKKVFDTAIALKTDMFEEIENHSKSIKGFDTAIVSAVFIQTKEKMIFVSGHVPGFDLEEPGILLQAVTRDGDNYCQGIIDAALSIEKDKATAIQIIGLDMNSSPEDLEKTAERKDRNWTHRFEKFEDSAYKLYRTKKATNVNPNSKNYCERELDFIFVRTLTRTQESGFSLKSIFSLGQPNISGTTQRLLKWDISLNASDHRPILVQLSL